MSFVLITPSKKTKHALKSNRKRSRSPDGNQEENAKTSTNETPIETIAEEKIDDSCNSIKPFHAEDRVGLALIVHAATAAVQTKSGDVILQSILKADQSGLVERYHEVKLLKELHQLRDAVRELYYTPTGDDSSSSDRNAFTVAQWNRILACVATLPQTLPEPLFPTLHGVITHYLDILSSVKDHKKNVKSHEKQQQQQLSNRSATECLEMLRPYIISVTNGIQTQLLAQTNSLTSRCESLGLTLELNAPNPFPSIQP